MPFAKFIVIQPGHATREVLLDDGVVTIGRALDNTIALEDDFDVSRYHAEIEEREGEFWVVDLGSSNGTTVNDVPVEFDHPLRDGDLIGVGGSAMVEIHLSESKWQASKPAAYLATESEPETQRPQIEAPVPASSSLVAPRVDLAAAAPQVATVPSSASLSSPMLIVAGVGGGLILTALIGVVIYKGLSPSCNPSVRVVSPQTGTTIRRITPVRIEAQGVECIERVIYKIDGVAVAKIESSPYDIVLDPAQMRGLSGGNHVLTLVVEDEDGNFTVSQDTLLLAFDDAPTNQSVL